MRIGYILNQYISYMLTGKDFIACLQSLGHEVMEISSAVCTSPEHFSTMKETLLLCDVIILHDEPANYPLLFTTFPLLNKKHVIAYTVWETTTLPESYRQGLSLCNDIWTCSEFSASSLRKHFSHVKVVPHIVKRLRPSSADIGWAKQVLPSDKNSFTFFSLADTCNPRKNVEALLKAFTAVRLETHKNIFLVLKQYRLFSDYASVPHVISIQDTLSSERIAALHILTNAYISAHHCEAWGLGLSEAMAYGKPVIATGYSGNMEFMNKENSFPLPYKLTPVSQEMIRCFPLFTDSMQWADVDEDILIATMKNIISNNVAPHILDQARKITTEYSFERVVAIMNSFL